MSTEDSKPITASDARQIRQALLDAARNGCFAASASSPSQLGEELVKAFKQLAGASAPSSPLGD
jgi:hypothetical protein